MARYFSGIKIMSALLSDGFLNAVNVIRRGYAAAGTAASQKVASSAAAEGAPTRSVSTMKMEEEEERSTETGTWVPDPVTGYYRPKNYVDEIDAVDLRAMLLKPRRNIIN